MARTLSCDGPPDEPFAWKRVFEMAFRVTAFVIVMAIRCPPLPALNPSIRDFVRSVRVTATVADTQGYIYLAGYGQVESTAGLAQSAFGGGHYDAIIAKWSP